MYLVTDAWSVGWSASRARTGIAVTDGCGGDCDRCTCTEPVASPRSTTRVRATTTDVGERRRSAARVLVTLSRGCARRRERRPAGTRSSDDGRKLKNVTKKYRARSCTWRDNNVDVRRCDFKCRLRRDSRRQHVIYTRTHRAQRPPTPPRPGRSSCRPRVAPPATATYARGFRVRETRLESGRRRWHCWDLSAGRT